MHFSTHPSAPKSYARSVSLVNSITEVRQAERAAARDSVIIPPIKCGYPGAKADGVLGRVEKQRHVPAWRTRHP